MKRLLLAIVLFVLLMGALIGCDQNDRIAIPEGYALLEKRENFKDSLYEATFSKAFKELLDKKEYKVVAALLVKKGKALDYYLKYDSIYLKQSIQFINEHNTRINANQNMKIRYYIGSQYDFGSNFTESKKWLLESIASSENPERDTLVGISHKILSSIYRRTTALDSAQYHAFKALAVFETNNDLRNISSVQYNIHRISTALNDDVSALKSLDKMIYYGKEAKDTSNICRAYIVEAFYHINKDETYKNVINASDSLDHYVSSWSDPVPAYAFNNALIKTYAHLYNEDFKAAEEEALKADSLHDPTSYFDTYQMDDLNLKLSFNKNGTYDKEIFKKMIAASTTNKDYSRAKDLLDNQIIIEEKARAYDKAFLYLNKSNVMRDSIWNLELKSKIYEFEKKYETAKKEQQIIAQENTLLQRNSIIAVLALGLLTASFGFTIYNNRRKKRMLEKEYELQENYTNKLLQNTEQERSRIAGDLHDSVNHKLLLLSNKAKQGQNVSADEFAQLIGQVRAISHNLHPAMFEKVGLERSIEELVFQLMETTPLKITTQLAYAKELKTAQELQIYRIIEEALNNILKHSKATHAFIKLVSTASALEVKIKDNGEGFDTVKIRDKEANFGLLNIEQRSKAIKGIFNISSSKNGTELRVTLKT